MRLRSRTLLAAPLLLAGALLATACGGSGDTDTADGTTAPPAAGAETISVDHAFGTTTLDGVPERIVSLDPQFTDALLALDVAPAAFITSTSFVEGGIFPWQDGLDSVTQIDFDGVDYDNQDVFNAEPDLIVGSYTIEDEERYAALSDIAPTIGAVDPDREVQRWQDMLTLAGSVTGKVDEAAELIGDTEAALAGIAEELPGLDGMTYTFVNYVPGDALYVVADPDDGAAEAFATLGLTINPKALEAADGDTGRAKFSLEQVDLLDSDLIIMLANGGNPEDLIGFDALRASKSGAVQSVDFSLATALNQPSVLSLPWAFDQLRPILEKAAG